jgi:hypothetical protein
MFQLQHGELQKCGSLETVYRVFCIYLLNITNKCPIYFIYFKIIHVQQAKFVNSYKDILDI